MVHIDAAIVTYGSHGLLCLPDDQENQSTQRFHTDRFRRVSKSYWGSCARAEITPEKKAAIESGRKGDLTGGNARANKLTAEQRSEIAKKAAATRWGK